ncbi:lytic murein transglycosylase [Ensifer sp. MPMI2T]|nr:lytic murein transglycosylase [Ensifer sp. MPMI2T]
MPLWPAGHLPHKGGEYKRLVPRSDRNVSVSGKLRWRRRWCHICSPRCGEMAGRPEGVA